MISLLVPMTGCAARKRHTAWAYQCPRLEQYDKAPEGTLASVVTSKNPYARRFVNMVLGKVQMCSRYEDLKKILG